MFISACGLKKNIPPENKGISAVDYPYIEKFHKGLRLKTSGHIDEAVEQFEGCLAMRDDDDAVYYALSQLMLMQENFQKSTEYIIRAAEIDPNNTWYIQELAYMYYENKDFENAVKNFKKLVEIEPRNVDWQYGYASALQQTGDIETAIEALNKTEDQVGINPELSIQKYELYLKIKDEASALKEIEKARKVFPKDLQLLATLVDHYYNKGEENKAVTLLEELVEADPTNGRAYLALADIYRRQNNKAKSYAALKQAFLGEGVELDTKMQILISLQEISYKIEPELLELAKIVVETYPAEARAHSILGDYYLKLGDEDKALKSYQEALKYDKSKYPIWNQVLIMEYQHADYKSLYTHSTECLTLFPTITTVYLLKGVSANQLKKYEEALDALSVGSELIIDDRPLKAEFYGQMGEAYFGMKANEKGKESYKKALELDPGSLLLKSNFAYRLAMLKIDLQLAEYLAQQAIDGASSQSQFIDVYGFVLFQKGEYKGALSSFKAAYELNKEDKLIVEHLGDAYFMTGSTDDAVKYWEEAKALSSVNKSLERKIRDKKYYEPEF